MHVAPFKVSIYLSGEELILLLQIFEFSFVGSLAILQGLLLFRQIVDSFSSILQLGFGTLERINFSPVSRKLQGEKVHLGL